MSLQNNRKKITIIATPKLQRYLVIIVSRLLTSSPKVYSTCLCMSKLHMKHSVEWKNNLFRIWFCGRNITSNSMHFAQTFSAFSYSIWTRFIIFHFQQNKSHITHQNEITRKWISIGFFVCVEMSISNIQQKWIDNFAHTCTIQRKHYLILRYKYFSISTSIFSWAIC